MKLIFEKGIKSVALISIPLVTIAAILFYLNASYQRLNSGIESIKVVSSGPAQLNAPVVYITDSADVGTDFSKEFLCSKTNDSTFTIALKRKVKLRQFRLYFSDSIENVTIKKITLQVNNEELSLDLSKFGNKNVKVIDQDKAILSFTILPSKSYSYFESPQFYYPTDYPTLLIATIVITLLTPLSFLLISRISLSSLSSITLSELGVLAFIISIFLPQRIFNITLVVSILLVIRNFNFQFFLRNRVNLLFISIYALILLNFFIIYPESNLKAIERYTLFLVLPVYVSCIRSSRLLVSFCIAALLIGCVLVGGALIDLSIFKNLNIISFNNFTRTIHPVYYSYLLAFSILYIEFNFFLKHKYLIQIVLILLLILSSSKLIIFVTILWFAIFVRKPISVVIVSIIILALIVFAPTKERFGSVINFNDLSVVSEKHIQDPDDPRLNGFTLRIILWQESLTLSNAKEFLFGKGVALSGNRALEINLQRRGLIKHLDFNAHNQYVTMMFKTGIIGFILLLTMIIYCIKWGIKTNSKTLISFMLLMSFAMLSESIFERAFGITFFCMIILLLINSELLDTKRIDQRNIIDENN